MIINSAINKYKSLKSERILKYIFSNTNPRTLLGFFKKRAKPFSFTSSIYKLQLDLDIQLYSLNLNSFLRLFTNDNEDYFFDEKYSGIPTKLKVFGGDNDFIEFPNFDFSRLHNHSKYAIMTFKETGNSYSTKATLNIKGAELESIEVYKITSFKRVKLIAKANKQRLTKLNLV